MPSACCQRFIWDVIQQLIQSCSLLDCVVSHENVLPDVITLFSREQSLVFLLVVWCILWLPLRTCCYPVFVHDLWLKVKWKKQLFSEAFRATTKTNIFEALSKFFWTNEGGKINKNVHLIVFQQHGIHSKEFGRTNKISYLLLSIQNPAQQSVRNPAQKSVRTTHSFLKVLSWEVLKAVSYWEDVNANSKALLFYPEICSWSQLKERCLGLCIQLNGKALASHTQGPGFHPLPENKIKQNKARGKIFD